MGASQSSLNSHGDRGHAGQSSRTRGFGDGVVCRKRSREDGNDETDDLEIKRLKLESTMEYMYSTLYCNGEYSDVTVEAFNKQWHLHKLCLSRVDFFKNIFKGGWSESLSNKIIFKFSDELITEEAFSKTLESLYTGNIDLNLSNAANVLAVASWFGMEDLMELSTDFLTEILSFDTVVQNIELSKRYNRPELKSLSVKFLAYNFFIKRSPNLIRNINVDLMQEILTSKHLAVMNLEKDVYYLLKKHSKLRELQYDNFTPSKSSITHDTFGLGGLWLFLKLNKDWNGTEHELNFACEQFFKDFKHSGTPPFPAETSSTEIVKEHSFLETKEGSVYQKAFESLRMEHAICSKKFCQIVKADNIIPKSWQMSAYDTQWSKVISLLNHGALLCANTPYSDELFEKTSVRCGRDFKKSDLYCWSWVGLNYGCDLVFSWDQKYE
ncbi:hypothetical protein HELRODRAFT_189017 [Helobdella robusta]|uniref:BTB domain-containing protein n=1 Tax=Helobdella robusta TaxID=6412 RepID=T1FQK5_HELRO|nr:hypothetical protein HELRODRAFT_189017 [Helobdella robusta]ESN99174.1 hypothetical protein HELRODRAFT_189017 [Helobdella robusta]